MASDDPEIGRSIQTGTFQTNFHEKGAGYPVLLLHGSGPGVTAWANWRLTIPALAERFRVIAPDIVGFGYTDRPAGIAYSMDVWVHHVVDLMDALGIEQTHLVGNSFGGGLALALAIRHPDRVNRLVLMGSVGVPFDLTPGLDAVWGYEPSIHNMRALLDIFAYDRTLVSDELAQLRYEASIKPGVQEAFGAMFPTPRQRWIVAMSSPEDEICGLGHETLIIHGRDDKIIPLETSLKLSSLIDKSQLHVFGRCGHWTQIEHSNRFNRLLTDFFTE